MLVLKSYHVVVQLLFIVFWIFFYYVVWWSHSSCNTKQLPENSSTNIKRLFFAKYPGSNGLTFPTLVKISVKWSVIYQGLIPQVMFYLRSSVNEFNTNYWVSLFSQHFYQMSWNHRSTRIWQWIYLVSCFLYIDKNCSIYSCNVMYVLSHVTIIVENSSGAFKVMFWFWNFVVRFGISIRILPASVWNQVCPTCESSKNDRET